MESIINKLNATTQVVGHGVDQSITNGQAIGIISPVLMTSVLFIIIQHLKSK